MPPALEEQPVSRGQADRIDARPGPGARRTTSAGVWSCGRSSALLAGRRRAIKSVANTVAMAALFSFAGAARPSDADADAIISVTRLADQDFLTIMKGVDELTVKESQPAMAVGLRNVRHPVTVSLANELTFDSFHLNNNERPRLPSHRAGLLRSRAVLKGGSVSAR